MKICPQCKKQFENSLAECPDCGCPLLVEHGPDQSYPWKCVRSFTDEAIAKPAAMYLSDHDVPAVVQPRFNAIFGTWSTVELWVPEHMADRAEELLQHRRESDGHKTVLTSNENDGM